MRWRRRIKSHSHWCFVRTCKTQSFLFIPLSLPLSAQSGLRCASGEKVTLANPIKPKTFVSSEKVLCAFSCILLTLSMFFFTCILFSLLLLLAIFLCEHISLANTWHRLWLCIVYQRSLSCVQSTEGIKIASSTCHLNVSLSHCFFQWLSQQLSSSSSPPLSLSLTLSSPYAHTCLLFLCTRRTLLSTRRMWIIDLYIVNKWLSMREEDSIKRMASDLLSDWWQDAIRVSLPLGK